VFEEGLLLCHAGADAVYSIEDVHGDAAEELLGRWMADDLAPEGLSAAARRLWLQLLTAGAVLLQVERPVESVGLRCVGDQPNSFITRLVELLAGMSIRVVPEHDAPLLVFLRTNGRLGVLCDETYANLRGPHLLVDLAYQHTLSLGPLVFPGDTACLACLVGRLTDRWGDALPPPQPGMLDAVELVGSLLALHLRDIAMGGQALINRTVAYDFEEHEIKKNRVHKLPWCPVCSLSSDAGATGRIELPAVIGS
jgi:hypothetical protein